MNALEPSSIGSWVIAYLLNSLWQVPLIFVVAWAAARLARPAGPRIEHRIWVGALIAQALLPACQFDPDSLWQQAKTLFTLSLHSASTEGHVRTILGSTIGASAGLLLPPWLRAALAIAYASGAVYFVGRLAWGIWKTALMQRNAQPLALSSDLRNKLAQYRHLFGLQVLGVATSSIVTGPVTVGIRRRLLLLPPDFVESVAEADLDAVLAHEFAHMQRHDFAKNLLYSLLSLPIAWHPALWLTTARLAESREMVCDELAAEAVTGPERYARSLLRLASMLADQTSARTLHAIGIFDANIFERRVMNLTRKRPQLPQTRRFMIVSACILATIATCASAMALHLNIGDPVAESASPSKIKVKVDTLKQVNKVQPVYPVEAKKKGIQGSVLLDVVIGKDGHVEHIEVTKGPQELQQSALDAVREWTWEPVLLNGDPIEAETTVTVVYQLGN